MDFCANRRFPTCKSGFFNKPVIDTFCGMFLFFKTLTGIFIKAVFYEFDYVRCKNSRFTVRRFPFPRDSIPFTVFFNSISGNAHRFCDMSLTFASQETPANFIVILHCDNHLISLRIKRLLFRVLFKWLTFKLAFGIKMAHF